MSEEQNQINDALVFGEIDDDLLDRQIEVGISPFGSNTKPGRWRKWNTSVRDMLTKLSVHEVGEKDGNCFLGGSVIDGERKAMAIPHMDLCVLDLDTGEDIDTIKERIQALGLFAMIYTTHSHLKPISDPKKDAVVKWLGDAEVNPDIEQIKAYLIEVKRYQPEVLEGAVLLETKQTAEGVKLFVKHQPMPKFRVVFLLKERFVFMDRPGTHQDAIKEWKERYAGASKMLGAFFDRSCVDPSRLFFLPRHPKDAPEFRVEVIAGKPLDLNTVDRVTAQELRVGSGGAFEQALGAESGGRDYKTDGMLWFFKKYGDLFDIETFLLEVDGDGDRGSRPSGSGRTHRCPNDDAHTNAGDDNDVAFFCVNATESETGKATAHCRHDSCSQLDRIDFVDLICERIGITSATDLKKWVPETVEDSESEENVQTSDSSKLYAPYRNIAEARRAVANIPENDREVGQFVARCLGMTPDSKIGETQKDELRTSIATKSGIAVMTLKKEEKVGKQQTNENTEILDDSAIAQLSKLNREYAVVLLGTKLRIKQEKPKGRPPVFLEKETFTTWIQDQKIKTLNSKGDSKLEPLSTAWLEWPDHRRYVSVVFEPDGEQPGECNIWNGFPVEGKKGDWGLLKTHVFENICQGDLGNFTWLMTWVAQIFQQPGVKLGSAVVVRGRKGTGKSIFFDFVRMALGDTSLKVSHRDHITNQFNAHQQGLVLMVAEEAFWAGDTSAGGILKDLITSTEMLMTPKGIDSQKVSNYMRLAMVSNEEWVVPAGFEDERRFLVLKCGDGRFQDIEFFAKLSAQMKKEGGLAAMVYDLMHWKPTIEHGWDGLRKPPITPWLTDQAKESMPISEKFFLKLVTDGGMQVANRPDALLIKDLELYEDQENLVSKKDLEWFYDTFILKSNAGKHKFGDAALTKKLVEDWLLADPRVVRSRKANGYLPTDREYCYKLPPLTVIRQDLAARKHISFEEILDEDDEPSVKAA